MGLNKARFFVPKSYLEKFCISFVFSRFPAIVIKYSMAKYTTESSG